MDDGTSIELYTVKRYWKVHENGDPELRFDVAPTNDGGGEQEEEQSPLPAAVEEHLNGKTENTIEALQDVVDIDDDNQPAPENVPQASEGDTESIFGAWEYTGFCNHCIQNIPNHPAKLNFPLDKMEKDNFVQLFLGLFPNNVLKTIISETNKTISGDPLSYGELLRWIGLWVLMSTVDGSD